MINKSKSHIIASKKFLGIASLVVGCFLQLLTASVAFSAESCCDSSSSCLQLGNETLHNCETAQIKSALCESFAIINSRKLKLQNLDLSPLRSSQKDVAGTYALNISAMTLLNEWKVGDADGITSDGNAKLSVKQICLSENTINLKGKYGWFSFSFQFNNKLVTRQSKNQTLVGLEGVSGKDRYLFLVN